MDIEHLLDALAEYPSDFNFRSGRWLWSAHKFFFDETKIPESVLFGSFEHCAQLLERDLFQLPFDRVLFQIRQKFSRGEITDSFVATWRDENVLYFRQWQRVAGRTYLNPVILKMVRCERDGWKVTVENVERLQWNQMRDVLAGHEIDVWVKPAKPPIWGVMSALGLINTEGIQIVQHSVSSKLNADRKRKGRVPIQDHSEIVIAPFAARRLKQQGEGKGTSPSMHWRRGHLRTLAENFRVMVRPCVVNGDGSHPECKGYRVRV